MQIAIMNERVLDEEIKELLAEFEAEGIEVRSIELSRKTFPGFHEVIIFVAVSAGHLVVAALIEKAVKWGKKKVTEHLAEPVVIKIFETGGIPRAAARVLPSGEVEEIDAEKIPQRAVLPIHLL